MVSSSTRRSANRLLSRCRCYQLGEKRVQVQARHCNDTMRQRRGGAGLVGSWRQRPMSWRVAQPPLYPRISPNRTHQFCSDVLHSFVANQYWQWMNPSTRNFAMRHPAREVCMQMISFSCPVASIHDDNVLVL